MVTHSAVSSFIRQKKDQDYYFLLQLCWMNTCIVVCSWHMMILHHTFKQPRPPTPADVSGCRESETRPEWPEVCLCWCPGVYGRSPFECQGSNCLKHSFFPSVRRFCPGSSQCQWSILNQLPRWGHILARKQCWRMLISHVQKQNQQVFQSNICLHLTLTFFYCVICMLCANVVYTQANFPNGHFGTWHDSLDFHW